MQVQSSCLTLTKINGHDNHEIGPKTMFIFIACEASSKKTFDLVSANLIGSGCGPYCERMLCQQILQLLNALHSVSEYCKKSVV